MPPSPLRLALCSLLLAAAAGAARALNPALAVDQYSVQLWGEEEGLPQSSVGAMVQSRDGYLWLGTQEGLARFDGVRFTVFDSATVPELAANHVQALLPAPGGGLWVGTVGGGLLFYRHGRFHRGHTRELADASIMALAPNPAGGLWVGTDDGLYKLWARRFIRQGRLVGLTGSEEVRQLLRDGRGRLWAATANGLLLRAGGRWRRFTTADGLPDNGAYALAEGAGGHLWVGTAAGLALLVDPAAARFLAVPEVPAVAVRALLADHHGGLWVGTGEGLLRLRPGVRGGPAVLERAPLLIPVVSLLGDREGSLWIGSDGGGLTRLRAGTAVTFGAAQGLTDLQAYSVTGGAGGDLWVGTTSGAVFRLRDGRFTEIPSRPVLRSDAARSLLVTRDGALWIGSDHGLFRWDGRRFAAFGPAQGLPPFSVRILKEDGAGTLWVGTDGGGLARFAAGRFEVLTEREGLAGDQVRSIRPARGGGLWIGTYGGLSLYRGGRFTNYTTAQGLPSRLVRTLLEDPDGTLWIGTYGGGLARLRGGRIVSFRRRDGLFDDVIYQILDDGRGRLWMSSNRGVFRVERSRLEAFAAGRAASLACRAFGRADGMASRECNGGKPAGWRGADGRLWFPTVAGLVMFDPGREVRNRVPPPVAIEGVVADGRRLPAGREAVLPPGTHRLELFFTALSLVAAERNRFLYKLEGFDREWTAAAAHRDAVYTELPPGAYRFRVIAANNDGVWNREGASFAFRVRPFFYQTAVFYVLCVAAVLLAAGGTYSLRTRQLRARERELRRRVEEALARLKVLSGLLPICASCKKIRGDGGYWEQLEGYIRDHSEAEFSHGICPDCAARLYPGIELPRD